MATKAEKTVGTLSGILLGGILGDKYAKNNNIPHEEKWKYILLGMAGGGLSGYILSIIFGSPDDTVNYELYHRNKLVYHGITYKDRVYQREVEHRISGKKFTEMIIGNPIPRSEAMDLEKSFIKTDRPKYNIVHNR